MGPKEAAAVEAVKYVEDGMVVGLGSGSTASIAIKLMGEKVKEEGIEVTGIPTSAASDLLGRAVGIKIGDLDDHRHVDMTIDGADEVDADLNLVKGLGGALVREKMVAAATRLEMIVVDESKLVVYLGQKAPVPVEVVGFSHVSTMRRLAALGCDPVVRLADGKPYVTDNGNMIIDCKFERIEDPASLESILNVVPGVVDNGLFIGLADKVIVGSEEGVHIIERPEQPL
ncbi:MAG: ribose-5-phosphate isomerase RpiA [Methanobacteriota archaeon]|nr:MAG: ribose-5-phosphate isomerase RpiA [Euryarchaeota archaeon]